MTAIGVLGWLWDRKKTLAWLALVAGVYFYATCDRGTPVDDEPKEPIRLSDDELEDELPDADRSPLEHVTVRVEQPTGQGVLMNEEVAKAFAKFLENAAAQEAAAADTTGTVEAPPPIFPLVRTRTDSDGHLRALGVQRSDGGYEVKQFDCEPPCEAGTRDTEMYAHSQRKLALPFFELAATCGIAAGAGYLLAEAADYSHPGWVAAGAGGGCVFLKVR